jgi:methylmalonyl-CoA/ethylmalonyl-CoA epimerase
MESIPASAGVQFIDHVAITVPQGQLEQQVEGYKALGFTEVHREDVLGTDQVREVLLQIGTSPNLIQLLEPLAPDSPVAKQLEKNGGRGSLAHIAFRVASAAQAYAAMKESGYQILDEAPRRGSRNTTVFFVHPKGRAAAPLGYLLEIVEDPQGSGADGEHGF